MKSLGGSHLLIVIRACACIIVAKLTISLHSAKPSRLKTNIGAPFCSFPLRIMKDISRLHAREAHFLLHFLHCYIFFATDNNRPRCYCCLYIINRCKGQNLCGGCCILSSGVRWRINYKCTYVHKIMHNCEYKYAHM